MKIYVSYEGYFCNSGVTIYETTKSKKEAFKTILLNLIGFDSEEEIEEDLGKQATIPNLIENLRNINGDGMDFICSIISDDGEILFAHTQNTEKI